jgi:hypothetical protein
MQSVLIPFHHLEQKDDYKGLQWSMGYYQIVNESMTIHPDWREDEVTTEYVAYRFLEQEKNPMDWYLVEIEPHIVEETKMLLIDSL